MRKRSRKRPCPRGRGLHPAHRPPQLTARQLPLLDLRHQVAPARANPPGWRPHLHRSPWPGVQSSAPRTGRIPRSWRKSSLRSAQPAAVVQTVEHLTSSHLPLPCSKETETRAKEELKRGREEKEEEEEEDEKEGEDKREEQDKEGEDQKRGAPSSHVQTPTTLETKVNMVSMRPPCGSEDGTQHPQDLPDSKEGTRKITHCLGTPSSHSPAGGMPSLGPSDVVAPGCPDLGSSSCSTPQETFPKKGLELCDVSHSAELQESRKGRQSGKPQASAPGTCAAPVSAVKRPRKRKASPMELPPSPPRPQLQRVRGDVPPPPKIPRTDKGKELDSTMTVKGQVIHSSDDNVAVVEPRTQGVAARTAPQPALPLPRPAAGHAGFLPPASNTVSSSAASASSPLAPQADGPPIRCAPLPGSADGQRMNMCPSSAPGLWVHPGHVPALLSTAAITPSPLPTDFESMDTTPPSQAVTLPSPPVSYHVSTTLLAQAMQGPTSAWNHTGAPSQPSHASMKRKWQPADLRKPDGSEPAYGKRQCAASITTSSRPSPASLKQKRQPDGSELAVMDMDTTPPSAPVILPSPLRTDFESMDTTPPSQAVILPSPPVSTTLLAQAMQGPTSAGNHTGAPSQPTRASRKRKRQPDGSELA